MKFTKFLSATLCVAMGLFSFTSCGSDDDEPETAAAVAVAGSYDGDMTCTVMSTTYDFEDQTFVVTATGDNTVSVTIPAFGPSGMVLPAHTITDLKVSGSNDNYTIDYASFSDTVEVNGADKAYVGYIQGTVVDGELKLDFSITYGAMPMAMVCSFSGKK